MPKPTPPLRTERGSILILTALSMTVLLAIAALSIDTAFMYDKRNHLYAAADAAAKGAAIERWRSETADLQRFAYHELAVQGIDPTASGTTVTVRACDEAGATCSAVFTPSWHTYVEVIVSQQSNTFFGKILGWANLTPLARAVAGASFSTNCVVIFDHASFGNPAATSTVHSPTCAIVIGGGASTGLPSPTLPATSELLNYADITALSLGVVHTGAVGCDPVGQCSVIGGKFAYGVPAPSDPLADLPPYVDTTHTPTCTSPALITSSMSITMADIDMYYCGFTLKGGGSGTIVTFAPGTYFINGEIGDQTGAAVGMAGDGVTLFFSPAARINFDDSNNVSISMTAPTSGTYNGILMYQDRTTPVGTPAIFGKNNTDMAFKGALYFPTVNIQMYNENNPSLTNPCSLIVAWAVEVQKPHFEFNNQCLDFLGSPLLSASLAE